MFSRNFMTAIFGLSSLLALDRATWKGWVHVANYLTVCCCETYFFNHILGAIHVLVFLSPVVVLSIKATMLS